MIIYQTPVAAPLGLPKHVIVQNLIRNIRMLKTILCCFRSKRKSKVTVAPESIYEHKSGRHLIRTGPERFVCVTLMNAKHEFMPSVPASNLRPQRNGNDHSVISPEYSRVSCDLTGDSDDSTAGLREKVKTVLVTVDVERPKTGDTVSSRISLPPLNSASPSALKNRIKWNLKRRNMTVPTLENGTNGIGPEPKIFKVSSNDGHVKSCKNSNSTMNDEIITLPSSAEVGKRTENGHVHFMTGPGTGEALTLFFIHGVGGNSGIWTNQMKFFHEIGHNIVSIDLIGHGGSSVPKSKPAYSFDAIKADVFSIFDRFAHDKNVIIAHSYGTCFAAMLARERNEKISHLVLISSGAPVPLDPNDGAFAFPTAVLALLRPALSRTFMKLAFLSTPNQDDFNASFSAVKTSVLKRVMQGQRWSDCTYMYHQQIKSPTLLIYGTGDGLVSLDEMHEMRKAIPESALEVVDNAAHMVMLEQPAQVNRLIEAFLRKSVRSEAVINEDRPVHAQREVRKRPSTAISRTIPPSNVFNMRRHESLMNLNARNMSVVNIGVL